MARAEASLLAWLKTFIEADLTRNILRDAAVPAFADYAADPESLLTVLEDPVTPPASAPPEGGS